MSTLLKVHNFTEVNRKVEKTAYWPALLCLNFSPAGHRGVHPLPPVLWLHRPDGAFLLAAHGHNRLLRSIHVHQENLRCSQDRLSHLDVFFFFIFGYILFFFVYIFILHVQQALNSVSRKVGGVLRHKSPIHWPGGEEQHGGGVAVLLPLAPSPSSYTIPDWDFGGIVLQWGQ